MNSGSLGCQRRWKAKSLARRFFRRVVYRVVHRLIQSASRRRLSLLRVSHIYINRYNPKNVYICRKPSARIADHPHLPLAKSFSLSNKAAFKSARKYDREQTKERTRPDNRKLIRVDGKQTRDRYNKSLWQSHTIVLPPPPAINDRFQKERSRGFEALPARFNLP